MILNILGARVRVVEVSGLEDLRDASGQAMFDKNEIHIDKKLTGVKREQVIVHEAMHWALYRSGLREGMDKVLEEALCDVVSFMVTENDLCPKKKGKK